MGYTLTYRSCAPVDPEREAAVRQAVDAFNQGRDWILVLRKNQEDGHLTCSMEPNGGPDDRPAGAVPPWPGPYEAKCMLDALCGISRDCGVDWEIWATYSLRPVGVIRGGECHDDPEAHAEAVRNMAERLNRRNGG
jgi:hypothetical protein